MTALDEFAEFCGELTLDNGRPMSLEPFQREMLADYFGGVRESLILLPKKAGKTTALGALALYHLLSTRDAECVIGAASRDQATILYDQAAGFVRRTPALGDQVDVRRGYRELRADGGRIRVLAADVDTADGTLPSLALVDELHRHKSSELYAVFRDGLGPRQGQMVTISTAGDDEGSPLGRLRQMAHAQPGVERDGAHRYVRTADFAMHEWALEPDDDRDDLELVKLANPSSWQTVAELRKRHDSPSTRPWEWARFACGVWLAGEEGAISDREWRAIAVEGLEIPGGSPGVVIGIDLGWRHDCTAIVPVWRPDEGEPVRVGEPTILTPPGDGTSLDAEEIFDVCKDYADRWPEPVFVIDPEAGGEQLAQRLDAELNARVATHSQKVSPMALAAQRLSEAISTGAIEHPDHPGLNAHVLAAAAKPVGESWRFVKQRRKQMPIDGVIALAMAHSTLIGEAAKPSQVWFS